MLNSINKKYVFIFVSLLLGFIIGLFLGIINFIFWKKKGYTHWSNLLMSILAFFALAMLVLKII